jgi:hypothetical protein
MNFDMNQKRKDCKIVEVKAYRNEFDRTFEEWEDAANHALIVDLAMQYQEGLTTLEDLVLNTESIIKDK